MKNSSGDGISTNRGSWTFENISENFEDHVSKSVPFYNESHDLIGKYLDFFMHTGSQIVDIGCSTGLLCRKLANRISEKKDCTFIGIDSVSSMIDFAQEKAIDPRISFKCDDYLNLEVDKASAIISFYTAQFVHPSSRQIFMDKVFNELEWGGAFFLFEKVRSPDARFQDYASQIYTEYKISQGYSPENILNKSLSLKGVLEPFSSQGNIDLLKRAGFKDYDIIFKYMSFQGILAIK